MEKVKVAFLLNISDNWLGGLNYYRNLFSSIIENKDLAIEPVIIIPKNVDMRLFEGYPDVTIIKTGFLTRWHFLWFARKILCKLSNRDILFEKFLKLNNISIISHVQAELIYMKLPIAAWIPDFQHKYLPGLFSYQELIGRDTSFRNLAKAYDTVILSSNNAKNDFDKFFPEFKDKAEVLQFAVTVDTNLNSNGFSYLKEKYEIDSQFFYLPNQYWIHKNHKVVLEALTLLKQMGKKVLVISSGDTEDYRNKEYFLLLKQYIKEHNLSENYYMLGKIPYNDVQILAQNCLAFINPSLFEGWSTTVEEAKTMGKRILLSNIPVHLEQNPQGGEFFSPNNPKELADKLWHIWNKKNEDVFLQIDLEEKNKMRKREFSETYKYILENTIKRFEEKMQKEKIAKEN
ncbi:glycosyltransferase [Sporomusa sphaeroides]|uniref:glycosyltransferase n=1 Tax=Sporomusa sphaeroides TaxID=47679 RepID=UPI003158E827